MPHFHDDFFARQRIQETVLKEGEAGMPVAERCRKHGIRNATYDLWKRKYSGVQVSELQRLRD